MGYWVMRVAILVMVVGWNTEVYADGLLERYRPYLRQIEQRLQREPKSARLHTVLGRLYQKAGRWKEAEGLYRKALTLQSSYSHALVGLAYVAMHRKQWGVAKTLLRRVLYRDARHAPALALQSEWYRQKAMRSRAESGRRRWLSRGVGQLQQAIRYRPSSHEYRYRLGLLYVGLQQHVLAHRQFVQAVFLQKEQACYHTGLWMSEALLTNKEGVYQKLGKWLPLCRHALMSNLAQQIWMAHEVRTCHQLSAKGDRAGAIQRLYRAIELAPKADSGYLYLTLLLSQEKRCKKARQVIQLLLSRHPTHIEAKKLLHHPKALRCSSASPRPVGGHIRILRVTPRRASSPLSSPHVPGRTVVP